MIKIYGGPRTSAGRCYWMLEELGLPYETVALDMMGAKEHKSASYLKLNPNGKVPTLVDGDAVIWESMAINFYLAEKQQSPLVGTNALERGLIQQWSFWALAELQRPAVDWLIQEVFVTADKKDLSVIQRSKDSIPNYLYVLNSSLENKKYLVGDRFTLADLNVASVISIFISLKVDFSSWPNIEKWFAACSDRPSFQRLQALRKKT